MDKISVENGKYTFYIPDGDWRVYIDRYDLKEWVIVELGSEAVHALCAELEETRRQLRNLLAVIHRDGGHHTEKVGLEVSISDAMKIVVELRSDLDRAEEVRDAARAESNRALEKCRALRAPPTWHVTSFDFNRLRGVVDNGDRFIAFHSTTFRARTSRWPEVGEKVEVVFNNAGELLSVEGE